MTGWRSWIYCRLYGNCESLRKVTGPNYKRHLLDYPKKPGAAGADTRLAVTDGISDADIPISTSGAATVVYELDDDLVTAVTPLFDRGGRSGRRRRGSEGAGGLTQSAAGAKTGRRNRRRFVDTPPANHCARRLTWSGILRPSRSVRSKRSTAVPWSLDTRAECTSAPAAANAFASVWSRPRPSGAVISQTVCHGDALSSNVTIASGNGTDASGVANDRSTATRKGVGVDDSLGRVPGTTRARPVGPRRDDRLVHVVPAFGEHPVTEARRPRTVVRRVMLSTQSSTTWTSLRPGGRRFEQLRVSSEGFGVFPQDVRPRRVVDAFDDTRYAADEARGLRATPPDDVARLETGELRVAQMPRHLDEVVQLASRRAPGLDVSGGHGQQVERPATSGLSRCEATCSTDSSVCPSGRRAAAHNRPASSTSVAISCSAAAPRSSRRTPLPRPPLPVRRAPSNPSTSSAASSSQSRWSS